MHKGFNCWTIKGVLPSFWYMIYFVKMRDLLHCTLLLVQRGLSVVFFWFWRGISFISLYCALGTAYSRSRTNRLWHVLAWLLLCSSLPTVFSIGTFFLCLEAESRRKSHVNKCLCFKPPRSKVELIWASLLRLVKKIFEMCSIYLVP